jgi:peptide/nickel transport system substrate-binding protein
MYEPLIRRVNNADDPLKDDYLPWLAESYEILDDSVTMRMTLRQGITFTDGTPLTAAGVEEFFRVLFEYGPANGSAIATVLTSDYGTAVRAVSEYELEVTTTTPMSERWLEGLSIVMIASPEGLIVNDEVAEMPAGTGPYTLVDSVPEVSATFERNPDYWNPDSVEFETVSMHVYSDDVAALNALKAGQLDAAYINEVGLTQGAEDAGLTVGVAYGTALALFFLDRAGTVSPPLADVRVRQAINLAFDRESINEALYFGKGRASSQMALPGEPTYVEGGDDRYAFDLDRAKELMADAGYEDGFEVVIPTVGQYTKPVEPIVEASLASINITVNWEIVTDDQIGLLFTEKWTGGEYPIAFSEFPLKSVQLTYIKLFLRGFQEPEAAELYDTGLNAGGQESEDALTALGEYMLDNAWYVPIIIKPGVVLSDADIHLTLGIDPAGATGVDLWEFKAAR